MNERDYDKALDDIEAAMIRDYLAQVAIMANARTVREVTAMLYQGKSPEIARGANWGALLEDIRAAYIAGGEAEAVSVPKSKIKSALLREFNPHTDAASNWVSQATRDALATLQREQAAAVRTTVQAGLARGDAPRQIAIYLVGEKGAAPALGLSEQGASWVESARDKLLTGDPRDYLDRKLRDRRFDKVVERHIADGTRMDRETVDRVVGRYGEKILRYEAETNAAINALNAYNAGRNEFYEQLVRQGVSAEDITKRWKTRGDEHVRPSHRAANGQTVRGDGEFMVGGMRMKNPGDPAGGLRETARCRCFAIYKLKGEE